MNSITNYTSTFQINAVSVAAVGTTSASNAEANNALSKLENTKVSISLEARTKLAGEQNNAGKKIAEQMQSQRAEDNEPENVSEAQRLEKMIEDIQEQIKEVQRQLSALKGEDSEQVKTQRKALEGQLASLNATLIGLMGKKLEAVES